MSMNVPKFVHGATALAAAVSLYASALPASAAVLAPLEVVVDGPGSGGVPARLASLPRFATIGAAMNEVDRRLQPAQTAKIHVAYGTYKERVVVSKPNVHIIGVCRAEPGCEKATEGESDIMGPEEPERKLRRYQPFPSIRGQLGAETAGSLDSSATLFVQPEATNFFMKNMEVVNAFRPTGAPNTWPSVTVGVAASFRGDRTVIRNSRFLGRQDTLLLDRGRCTNEDLDAAGFAKRCSLARHYVADSYIEGTMDFIFGGGAAVINGSKIMVLPRVKGERSRETVITAQRGAFPSQQPNGYYSGFVISNSQILARNDIGDAQVALGRPWPQDSVTRTNNKPNAFRSFSRVVLINNTIAQTRILEGNQPWVEWEPTVRDSAGKVTRQGTNYLSTATLLASGNKDTPNSRGLASPVNIPGMRTISANEAGQYTPERFLQGGGIVPFWNMSTLPR